MTRIKIKNENGEWETMPIIKGEPGEKGIPGEKGEKGDESYPIGTIVEYDGDTIPSGFELVEDNSASVIVSSTEPTTGEEVWIQKGKNLYNESQYPLTYNKALNPADGATYSTSSGNYYATECYVPIDGAKITKITFSSNVTISFYTGAKIFISGGSDKQTYDVPSNAIYLRFDIHKNNINNIQIEKGEVASSYEPYTSKKIHTKTNDGYEEFYNEENREIYSNDEQKIGTHMGMPLYRKTISGKLPTNNNWNEVILNIENLKYIVRHDFYFDNSFSQRYKAPYYESSSYHVLYSMADSGSNASNKETGKMALMQKGFDGNGYRIDIEYTKTTD